jgi:hypothetical protein
MSHKLQVMFEIKSKKCIYNDCQLRPSYNFEGEKKGLYCFSHKLENMINVRSKKCIYNNCKKQPNYNIYGAKPLYCYEHKLHDMVDVKHKFCIFKDCRKRPNFNLENEIKGMYCLEHKLDGMIDVLHKVCISPNCKKRPTFNLINETKALYCSEHKQNEMIDILNKFCLFPNCRTIPIYNYYGETKRLYCFDHKLDGMVNVKHKFCKTHLCFTIVQDKYDGYCLRCYVNVYPNKPVSRNYKTKEYAVVEYVKNKFPAFTWNEDKTIQDGCSKKRPDLLLDLGYQILIIEIDENQHSGYDNICENKRMMELSKDLGHRPIIFIRFNPDDYLNENTNITSCWTYNKYGICVIKKSKIKEWNDRLCKLQHEIQYWSSTENVTLKTIHIVNLFYDL